MNDPYDRLTQDMIQGLIHEVDWEKLDAELKAMADPIDKLRLMFDKQLELKIIPLATAEIEKYYGGCMNWEIGKDTETYKCTIWKDGEQALSYDTGKDVLYNAIINVYERTLA